MVKINLQNKHTDKHLKILVNGSIISLIGTGLFGVLNYLVKRELSLSLSLTDFGFIYGTLSLCNIFLAYLDLGLGQSAIILIAKALKSKDENLPGLYYIQYFLIKLIVASIVVLVLSVTYKFWVYGFLKYNDPIPFFILLLLIIAQSITSAPSAFINALKRFGLYNAGQLLTPVTILFVIYIFNAHHSIIIYSLAFPLAAFVVFVFLFIALMIIGYYPKIKKIKDLFKVGPIFHLSKWIAMSTFGLTAMYYMDSIMLIWLDSLKAVGLYNIALPIVQIAQSLMVIPAVFLPIVAGMWAEDKKEDIANVCELITELTIYLFWPIAFTIILLAKYLIILLFSSKFASAAPALTILFMGNIFYSLANFYMGALNAGKYAKFVAITIVIATVVNIILNYFLIPYLSITGAAIATVCSYLFITVYFYILLRKNLKEFAVNKNKIFKFSISGIICTAIMLCFHLEWHFNLFYTLIVTVVINLIYFGVSFKVLLNYYKIAADLLKNR